MDTQNFVETSKNKVASFRRNVTVVREPATLSEHRARRGRWFDYVGDSVTECFKVTITFTSVDHTTLGDGMTHPSSGSTDTVTYFEIVTPFGRGCVISFSDRDELDCFIPNTGKALVTGCWKKYGSYRGHAVAYLKANRLSPSSSKVQHTCLAVIYDAARGKVQG